MTPEEYAASMVADPARRFGSDPTSAISHATTAAANYLVGTTATAFQGAAYRRAPGGISTWDASRWWTEVALALCVAAGKPRGAVLDDLAAKHDLP